MLCRMLNNDAVIGLNLSPDTSLYAALGVLPDASSFPLLSPEMIPANVEEVSVNVKTAMDANCLNFFIG